MATSTIPTSNLAGKNQTSPTSTLQTVPGGIMPGTTSTTASPAQQNSFVPVTPTSVIGGGGAGVASPGGLVQSPINAAGTTGALNKQLTDIYGKGVGGDLSSLLNSIGGVDSATLQEYIKSLAPQEATASANVASELGAAGVDPNSSVNAIAQSNLQAQEFGTIAGESANLTQSGQQLQAGVLGGMQSAAAQEVAQSGWDVFGQVIQGVGNLAGDVVGAAGKAGGFSNLF